MFWYILKLKCGLDSVHVNKAVFRIRACNVTLAQTLSKLVRKVTQNTSTGPGYPQAV